MGATKFHGYLLPDGQAFTEDLSCALVFYPDKDEYRRALLGAITYFETWIAWELDDDKRGKDAARAWALANACTLECWDMACIDELLATMEAVRALLENRKDCCDDNVSYGLQDEVETDTEPGVGDPPDAYGETTIVTWEDWEEHVCYNAHLYVDNLKNIGNQLGGAVEQNSLFLGLIAAALVLLTFSGVGLPIAYLLASFVVTGLVLAATSATFADTSDELESARNDIVCSLILGGNLAGEVEDAIGSAAWELFYQFVDYDSAMAIIHDGGIEGDYLPSETRDDCICLGADAYVKYSFDADHESFDIYEFAVWWGSTGCRFYLGNHPRSGSVEKDNVDLAVDLGGEIGYEDMRLTRIDFDYRFDAVEGYSFDSSDYMRLVVRAVNDPSQDSQVWNQNFSGINDGQWYHISLTGSELGVAEENNLFGRCLQFISHNENHHGGNYFMEFDNIEVWVDEVAA